MADLFGNLEALRREVADSGFDAVVAMSPENVPYISGVLLWTQRAIRDRLALVVWPRQGDPTFIVATNEEGYVREKSWIPDIRGYVQHEDSPIEFLAEVLREKGLAAGRLGFEPSFLTADFYAELTKALPEAEFLPCEPLFQRVRMLKTPAELELLTRAALATEHALMATYATVRPGETERSLVARLGANILQAGADTPAFLYLTVGPNTGYAHPDPTDQPVVSGDLIKSDCGGFFSGYYSDIGRTAVVGRASPERRSVYQRLMEVHRSTIAAMRPGTPASKVYQVAVEGYRQVEIPFGLPFAGHGLGLYIHEMPMLSAGDDTPLQPNMVFAVETRVRWPGQEGYHIEDLVVIREQGPEVVTTFMDTAELMEL
jgi:Xaa-Pro aminopeptidase